ncbi:hypothetical protein CPB86DRAFT_792324 [Serendipita vermifera]|nr:hypothetical protein CPB86DRAFT_792324 [Serendipita vermifera]
MSQAISMQEKTKRVRKRASTDAFSRTLNSKTVDTNLSQPVGKQRVLRPRGKNATKALAVEDMLQPSSLDNLHDNIIDNGANKGNVKMSFAPRQM